MTQSQTAYLKDATAAKIFEEIQKLQDQPNIPFRIVTTELADTLGVNRRTITRHLEKMIKLEILTKSGVNYALNKMHTEVGQDVADQCANNQEVRQVGQDSVTSETENVTGSVTSETSETRVVSDVKNRKREQSSKVPEKFTEQELFKLNRLLRILRTLYKERDFKVNFRKPMRELVGNNRYDLIYQFLVKDVDVSFSNTADPRLFETFIDFLSVAFCINSYNSDIDQEGKDIVNLLDGKFDPDAETFEEKIERSGIMNVRFNDPEDDEGEDDDEPEEQPEDAEDSKEFDDRDGWAERGDAGVKSSKHKLITEPRKVCFVEFTPEEIDGIVNFDEEAEVQKSPVKTFIFYVWDYLLDYYEGIELENAKNEEETQKVLSSFKLDSNPIESIVLQKAINEAYAIVKDVWEKPGYLPFGESDPNLKEDEEDPNNPWVDWSDKPMFDVAEADKVFRWERMKDPDGKTMFIASKTGIYNLEETVPKPVRPERKPSDPDYKAFLRNNAEYITGILDADEKELNDLEKVAVWFIRTYFSVEPSNVNEGCYKLVPPKKGVLNGEQIPSVDPQGNYLHGGGLKKLHDRLGDIRISPEEFQMCLLFPTNDRSFLNYIQLVPNMFWAQGMAYLAAQKGLQSRFAPSVV